MLPRFRLKHLLFLVFTLIASVPVLVLTAWIQQSALDKEISSVEEKHLLVAKNLTGDLERYVVDVESSLTLIANIMKSKTNIDGIPEHLDSLFLGSVSLTNEKVEVISQVRAKTQEKSFIQPFSAKTKTILYPLIQQANKNQKNVFYSNLIRTNLDETAFYLVKALNNNQYIIGILSTTHILEAQKKVSFGQRGHAAIVDRTGRAIAHPVPDWVRTMKDMSFLPPVQKMMQGETGVSKFFTPAMGADMVAGYTVVPSTGWGVMIPQPYEELEVHVIEVQLIALVIALVGIIMSGLFSWYIAGIISDPIQLVVDASKLDADKKSKPFSTKAISNQRFVPLELRELLNSFNLMRTILNNMTAQLQSKIDLANEEVKKQNDLLKEKSLNLKTINKKLEALTCTDALTDLYNRRHFDLAFVKELAYAKRHQDTLSLIMLDLDHFKNINDNYGHSAGDKVLINIASVISDNLRKSDIACRVGGEEFAILFRHTNQTEIRKIAETLRKTLEQHTMLHDNKQFCITASIGIITIPTNIIESYTPSEFYGQADKAMYHSKKNGRNQVTHYLDLEDREERDKNLRINL